MNNKEKLAKNLIEKLKKLESCRMAKEQQRTVSVTPRIRQ